MSKGAFFLFLALLCAAAGVGVGVVHATISCDTHLSISAKTSAPIEWRFFRVQYTRAALQEGETHTCFIKRMKIMGPGVGAWDMVST